MKDSVSSRYALALFSIAKEDKKINEYQKEVKELNKLFNDNVEFFNLLKSEFLNIDKRYKVIDDTLKSYSLVIRNFIKVLIQNHRLNDFNNIFTDFNSLCNEENHVIEGIVYSTVSLNEKEIKELESALEKQKKRKVSLTNKINPSLIGGIKVVLNNQVFDYSIASELEALRSNLKA